MAQAPEVKVGQIWKDRDRRERDRFIRIAGIGQEKALCERCDKNGNMIGNRRPTEILLRRFRPTSTGYDLVGAVKLT